MTKRNTSQTAAAVIITLAGAILGGFFLPFISSKLDIDIGRITLSIGLRLTGHLDIQSLMPQLHFVSGLVSGMLTLALWELYCCVLPRQKERTAKIILTTFRHPFVLAALLITAVLVGFIGTLGMGMSVPAPADDPLIANFHQNRRAFEQMRQEIHALPVLATVVADRGDALPVLSVPGLRATDIAQYQSLLADASVTIVEEPSGEGECYRFEMLSLPGNASAHDEKGYIYRESPPAPLVASLDGIESVNHDTYRHLDGNWYLYYQYRSL